MAHSSRINSYIRKADTCELRSREAASLAAKHEWAELACEWHWLATHVEALDESGSGIEVVSSDAVAI